MATEPVATYEFDQIADHATQMVRNLASQFQTNQPDAPNNFEKLIKLLGRQVQELENVFTELAQNRYLTATNAAVGAQLDALGQIVGEKRGGLSDDDYKVRIAARIRINLSSGAVEEILAALVAMIISTQASVPPLELKQFYPAGLTVVANGVVSQGVQIGTLLQQLSAAGVARQFVFATGTDAFAFSSTTTPEYDAATGFSDVAMTTGGQLNWVV